MELPIVLVLLVSSLLTVGSHPKNSDVIPKDYYKRQILQPIPGYIPVYIQTDAEPLIRREKPKHANVLPSEVPQPEEKALPGIAEEDSLKKLDPVKSEDEKVSVKSQEKV